MLDWLWTSSSDDIGPDYIHGIPEPIAWELAEYNSRRAKGILHNSYLVERMGRLQKVYESEDIHWEDLSYQEQDWLHGLEDKPSDEHLHDLTDTS